MSSEDQTSNPGAEDQTSRPGAASWITKVAPIVAAAVIFGTAGYLITPRSAQSATLQTEQSLKQIQSHLEEALASQRGLQEKLARTQDELASAVERAAAAEQATEAGQARLVVAEDSIAQLNEAIGQARQANEPIRKSLAKARDLAARHKIQADQAIAQAEVLANELAASQENGQQLGRINDGLKAEKSELTAALNLQKRTSGEIKRLLAVLDFGPEQADQAAAGGPAEMPITVGELIRQMGYPSLTFQRSDYVEMRWGDDHTASVSEGIVTNIDNQAASREVLASVATVSPSTAGQPGPWSIGQGQVLYADLVALFGKPDRVAGTGADFTAWWSVGAWARAVPAKVVAGVVTEFDGKKTDPQIICELIRQRTIAYKSTNESVRNAAATASAAYDKALAVIGKQLAEEAAVQAKDGIELQQWQVAPLESVGTWVGPANASSGSMTVRAWVDCTWTRPDGSATNERRYAVVTLFGKDQIIESAECEIFSPRN